MALAIALLQATHSPHPTIQQLTSNPPGLDGTEITVSGWIVLDDEKRYIVAEPHGYTMWRRGATCLSIINGRGLDEKASVYQGKHVDLRGVFRADAAGETVRLGLCSRAAIDLENAPADGKVRLSPPPRPTSRSAGPRIVSA
jgi:hypothetical protein